MASISASVGSGGVNKQGDVLTVERLLNQYLDANGEPPIVADGKVDVDTILAIQAYQRGVVGIQNPDGRIDPGGKTWLALDSGQGFKPAYSGADWWHANQARYPNSDKLADLASPFRENATAFVDAMKKAGADVRVSATRRNKTRAYLMHYCWRIAKGTIAPRDVPAVAGCAIKWDHGNVAKSKKGAQEMVELFRIAYQPSLTSNHIDGTAIDMAIGWSGTLKIKDKAGRTYEIGAPRTGDANPDLNKVGATYGVRKLISDPPHWSADGH